MCCVDLFFLFHYSIPRVSVNLVVLSIPISERVLDNKTHYLEVRFFCWFGRCIVVPVVGRWPL